MSEEMSMRTTAAKTVTGDANRDVLVSTAVASQTGGAIDTTAIGTVPTTSNKQTTTTLSDFYECVSVYEAFNGLLQQSSEQERETFFAEKRRRRSIENNTRRPKPRKSSKIGPSVEVTTIHENLTTHDNYDENSSKSS